MIPVSEKLKPVGEFACHVDQDREVGITVAEGGKRVLWTISGGARVQRLCLMPDTYALLHEMMLSDIYNNEDILIRFGDPE